MKQTHNTLLPAMVWTYCNLLTCKLLVWTLLLQTKYIRIPPELLQRQPRMYEKSKPYARYKCKWCCYYLTIQKKHIKSRLKKG